MTPELPTEGEYAPCISCFGGTNPWSAGLCPTCLGMGGIHLPNLESRKQTHILYLGDYTIVAKTSPNRYLTSLIWEKDAPDVLENQSPPLEADPPPKD